MKTAIVFSDGIKQIIFTPENAQERQALSLFTVDDNIELAIHTGSFGEASYKPFTPSIHACQGGYLRVFNNPQSIMFVLTPKKDDQTKEQPI